MNKKKIIGVISTGVIVFNKLLCENEPVKYSSKWFETISKEVLDNEREVVRKKYCSAGEDSVLADSMYRLLNRFDNVIGKRVWGDEVPHGPSYHREHGYNLFKEDWLFLNYIIEIF